MPEGGNMLCHPLSAKRPGREGHSSTLEYGILTQQRQPLVAQEIRVRWLSVASWP